MLQFVVSVNVLYFLTYNSLQNPLSIKITITQHVSAGCLPSSRGYNFKPYVAWCLAALNRLITIVLNKFIQAAQHQTTYGFKL
jgi:hypothetical protein